MAHGWWRSTYTYMRAKHCVRMHCLPRVQLRVESRVCKRLLEQTVHVYSRHQSNGLLNHAPDQPGFFILVIVREESAPRIRPAEAVRAHRLRQLWRSDWSAESGGGGGGQPQPAGQTAAQRERVQPTRNLASSTIVHSHQHHHHHNYTSLLNCLHHNPHSYPLRAFAAHLPYHVASTSQRQERHKGLFLRPGQGSQWYALSNPALTCAGTPQLTMPASYLQ